MACERREPIVIASGDTVQWYRLVPNPNFYSGAGAFLDYEIRGGAAAISFQSTPDPDGTGHDINVTAAVTALWLPGQMLMEGYAVNNTVNPPQRERIYFGELTIAQNLEGSQGDIDVRTLAQKMLEKIEAVLEGRASQEMLESRIGETMFRHMTPQQLTYWHGYWYCKRKNEIQIQRAKNGQNPGQQIAAQARITTPGPVVGAQTYIGAWG